MPRLTREGTQRNRARILSAAGRRLREVGLDGAGIDEIMSAAGLTHGGFYNHFTSKDALVLEAVQQAFTEALDAEAAVMARATTAPRAALTRMVNSYLSAKHRDEVGAGCPAPALAGDAARQGAELQEIFGEGIEGYLSSITSALLAEAEREGMVLPKRDARAEAIAILSELVGALVLSRAVVKARPRLSNEILRANRTHAGRHRT
jgi:TetR/AcrR family transcriptional regulator, transcriptional repressor for nem operon